MFIKILVDRVEMTISVFKYYQQKDPQRQKKVNIYLYILQQLIKKHTLSTQ